MKSSEILLNIAEQAKIKIDTLTLKVFEVINEDLVDLKEVTISKNFYSFLVKTKSGKLVRINFNIQNTNSIKTKNYRRTFNWKIFYV